MHKHLILSTLLFSCFSQAEFQPGFDPSKIEFGVKYCGTYSAEAEVYERCHGELAIWFFKDPDSPDQIRYYSQGQPTGVSVCNLIVKRSNDGQKACATKADEFLGTPSGFIADNIDLLSILKESEKPSLRYLRAMSAPNSDGVAKVPNCEAEAGEDGLPTASFEGNDPVTLSRVATNGETGEVLFTMHAPVPGDGRINYQIKKASDDDSHCPNGFPGISVKDTE